MEEADVDVDALDRLFGRYTPEIIRTVSVLSGDDAGVAKEHLARLRRRTRPGKFEKSGRDQKRSDGEVDVDGPVSPEDLVRSLSLDVRSHQKRRAGRGGDVGRARPTGTPQEKSRMREAFYQARTSAHEHGNAPTGRPREGPDQHQYRTGGYSDGLPSPMQPRGGLFDGPPSAFSSTPMSRPGTDDSPTRRIRACAGQGARRSTDIGPPPPVSAYALGRFLGTRRTAPDSYPAAAPRHARRRPADISGGLQLQMAMSSVTQTQMAIEMSFGEERRERERRMRIRRPNPAASGPASPPAPDPAEPHWDISEGGSPPPRGHPAERTLRSLRLWRFGRRSQARTRARARLEEDSAESVRTPDDDDDDDDGRSVGGDSQATLRMSGSLCSPSVGGDSQATLRMSGSLCSPEGRAVGAGGDGPPSPCPAKESGSLPTAMGTPFEEL